MNPSVIGLLGSIYHWRLIGPT